MKKITGKVVSLVLALALVVTSFSATFAFAAKQETATVTLKDDTVYLANGGANATELTADVKSYFDVKSAELYDHVDPGTLTLKEVVLTSGSSIATLSATAPATAVSVILKNANVTGKITLAGRYEGSISRDGTEVTTVYGTATVTVNVLEKGISVIGSAVAPATTGDYPATLDTLAKNDGQTVDGAVYKLGAGADALATWGAQAVDTTGTDATYKVTALPSASVTVTPGTNKFTLKTTKVGSEPYARVGNIAVQAVKYVGTAPSTNRLDIANGSTKIANKVVADTGDTTIYVYRGGTYIGAAAKADTVSPNTDKNVTGADIDISGITATGITMQNGSVGTITGAKDFIMQDGSVAAIGDTVTSFTMTKGTVGTVKAAAVTINGGKTGDITSATSVAVDATDATVPTVVGKISAPTVGVNSTKAAVVAGAITAPKDATMITLKGENTTVGQIDADYRTATVAFDGFKGTIVAPLKSANLTVTSTGDTVAAISGAANLPILTVSAGTVKFPGSLKVGTLSGTGTVEFNAGQLYATGSITGVSLKLANSFKVGDVAFSADSYKVYEGSFTGVGFTVEKVTGTTVDTFKVKTVDFANIQLNKTSSKIVLGQKETFTVSNYPANTKLPDGYTVKFTFDGGDDYFNFTSTATTATLEAKKFEKTFTSLNQGKLTATVMDPYGFAAYGYTPATCDVTIIEKPETTYKSDTTSNVAVATKYTFKITSLNGKAPTFAVGNTKVFTSALTNTIGNDYYYTITAVGKVGEAAGIYVNGEARLVVATIKANFKSDTTSNITVKGAYTYKITAAATPTFAVGTPSAFTAAFVSKTGNDYLYKITSVGKAGTAAGIYVNGVKVNVATVG